MEIAGQGKHDQQRDQKPTVMQTDLDAKYLSELDLGFKWLPLAIRLVTRIGLIGVMTQSRYEETQRGAGREGNRERA